MRDELEELSDDYDERDCSLEQQEEDDHAHEYYSECCGESMGENEQYCSQCDVAATFICECGKVYQVNQYITPWPSQVCICESCQC